MARYFHGRVFCSFLAWQLFPMGALSPRRRRCSPVLQKVYRVLAATFFYGLILWLAVQSDPYPAPLFAHFFWQDRKSRPAERRLRCRRIQQQSGANRKMAGHPSGHFAYIAPCRPPAAAGRLSVARRPRRCAGMRRRRRTAAVRSSSDEACPSPISSCASSSADTPS